MMAVRDDGSAGCCCRFVSNGDPAAAAAAVVVSVAAAANAMQSPSRSCRVISLNRGTPRLLVFDLLLLLLLMLLLQLLNATDPRQRSAAARLHMITRGTG